MKKVVFLAVVVFLMGIFFAGCNQEEMKKLQEQVNTLTQERDGLKAKEAELTKARDDLNNQLNTLKAENDQLKKDMEACPKKDEGKKEEAKKDAKAPEKKEAAKKEEKKEEKKPAAPAEEKKPKFKAAPAKAK